VPNRWDCDFPGCDLYVIGCGGAVGLRAIGWYFVPGFGNNLFCPQHRPDATTVRTRLHGDSDDGPCSSCQADAEAMELQNRFLNPFFGFEVLHDTDPRIKQFVDGAELT